MAQMTRATTKLGTAAISPAVSTRYLLVAVQERRACFDRFFAGERTHQIDREIVNQPSGSTLVEVEQCQRSIVSDDSVLALQIAMDKAAR